MSSKILSWVALDRAVRISRQRGLPAAEGRWSEQRNAIYREVMKEGWNPQKNSFVQQYGSEALDASVLLMPLVKFVGPTGIPCSTTTSAWIRLGWSASNPGWRLYCIGLRGPSRHERRTF